MHIRSYQDSDQPAVIALWKELLYDSAQHNDPATSIRNKLVIERELLLVAELDGEVVGTVMGGYDGHRGWVYSVAVAPRCQRQGIGAALVRHLEAALVARGCLKINLQVRSTNAQVIAFYRQLGYDVEDRVSMGKRMY